MNYRIFDTINRILDYLEDEESKKVFLQRVLYRFSGDLSYIFQIAGYSEAFDLEKMPVRYEETEKKYNIYPNMDVLSFLVSRDYRNKKIIVFGAGDKGMEMFKLLSCMDINVDKIWDNGRAGESFFQYVVEKPEKSEDVLNNALIIITSQIYAEEMKNQLLDMGFVDCNIFCPGENAVIGFYGEPYFDNEYFKAEPGEIFVDAGAYGMETAVDFARWCPEYGRIYSFEPDEKNYERCKNKIKEVGLKNTRVYPLGLWDKEDTLYFKRYGDDGTGSYFGDMGDVKVSVNSLDNILQGEPVSFIKMDIEGSELKALEGAKKTIQKYRPKLAICLYHKPDDIFELPLYIKELVPEYKMSIRHYTTFLYDTVLYCWV